MSRNITSSKTKGIGAWTDAEIKTAITQGKSKDGSPLKPPMGFGYYAHMTAADLDAVVAYLRTVPAQGVRARTGKRPSFRPSRGLYLGCSPGFDLMRFKPLLIAVLALAATSAAVPAQERRVPNAGELRLSYAPVVQRVAPAVVNVYAAKTVQQARNPLFDDPIFRRFFGVPGGPGGRHRCSARSAPA